jgi:lysophospholipase L1-like esterase
MDSMVFCKNGDKCMQIDMKLMPDGLHPSAEGYKLWGREIKNKVEELGGFK